MRLDEIAGDFDQSGSQFSVGAEGIAQFRMAASNQCLTDCSMLFGTVDLFCAS
jgi:hypothetical protein